MGLYEFNYISFGLMNTPATFVRMIRALLRGVSNVSTYIDDMYIYSENFDDSIITMKKKIFKGSLKTT